MESAFAEWLPGFLGWVAAMLVIPGIYVLGAWWGDHQPPRRPRR